MIRRDGRVVTNADLVGHPIWCFSAIRIVPTFVQRRCSIFRRCSRSWGRTKRSPRLSSPSKCFQRTTPPQVDEACRTWVDVPNDPAKPPVTREGQHTRVLIAEKDRMIEAREARRDDCVPSVRTDKKDETPAVFFDVMLRLEDRPSLREALGAYCASPWTEWAERDKAAAIPSRLPATIRNRATSSAIRGQ